MFGAKAGGAAAYSTIGLETGVTAASPHKLIVMLFDGALQALRSAREQIKAGQIEAKGNSITQAVNIITNGLRASLDPGAGGEIAASLDALYDYMARRLMHAHARNDVAAVDEIEGLLAGLRDAWNAIGQSSAPQQPAQPAQAAQPPAPPKPLADPLAPRTVSFVSA